MKKVLLGLAVGFSPLLAMAQTYTGGGIAGLFALASYFLGLLVPLFIGVAVVYFIWQVFNYTIAGDEEKKKEAKTGIIWGIVGLFVMVSIWGLVAILQSTFNINGNTANIGNPIPTLNGR
jgi:hypothetical protein